MMKQKVNIQKPIEKINIVDGPPLDFSFKNIRNIDCKSSFIKKSLN